MTTALGPVKAQPLAVQQTGSLVEVIARAAADPNIDVSKMERLLAMHERLIANEAEAAFNKAMVKAQSEMPDVEKDARNQSTNSLYAKLETVHKAIKPVIAANGFALSYGTADCPLPEHIRTTCTVSHDAGHSRNYQVDLPIDCLGLKGMPNKTRLHGAASAMTYSQRYLAILIFNVTVRGLDNDGNGANKTKPVPSQSADGATADQLRRELWEMLKPVSNGDTTWKTAKQWLVDECCIDPSEKISDMTADQLRAVIQKAKGKL